MVGPTCKMLNKWKNNGKTVTHVRLDNTGENDLLQKHCNSHDWKLVMNWEFTSRNTPQQYSIAEVAFWTIKH